MTRKTENVFLDSIVQIRELDYTLEVFLMNA